jgi:hypothetical protein
VQFALTVPGVKDRVAQAAVRIVIEPLFEASFRPGSYGFRPKRGAKQQFRDYTELLAKVSPQGPLAIERAQRFAGATDIVIPMKYELNLL